MIYFLFGEDTYSSKAKLNEIVEGYKKVHKSGLNLIWLDAEEEDFEEFISTFRAVPMFSEKKLVVLTNVFLNKEFQESLMEDIKKINEAKDIVVVYQKEKIDSKNKLLQVFKKTVKCQEFPLLDMNKLRAWVKKEFDSYGAKIDPLAEGLLLSFVGNNMWQLGQEIKKLSYFKPGKTINKEDVELQVRSKIENDIFQTIDAIVQKDKKRALTLLAKHLSSGDNPLYLLSMFAYQFRNMLTIKELSEKKQPYNMIVKESGLHPFVVKKAYYASSAFTFQQLKDIYEKIFQTDLDIKTGRIDPEAGLELLVAGV